MSNPTDAKSRGEHPSAGYPGKLYAARNHAPADASEGEIFAVAREAFEEERLVPEVWRERTQHTLEEY